MSPLARTKSHVRALFVCGSLNQTTQMHAVARALPEVAGAFTPLYGARWHDLLRELGLFENTVLGHTWRNRCLDYLRGQELRLDIAPRARDYDLIVTCTDLVLPSDAGDSRVVVVQEGMLDSETAFARCVLRAGCLPLATAGTTWTGLSGRYDRFCVASDGYRELFIRRGAAPARVCTTGIPNFDDCRRFADNDVTEHGYVLACTSDLRETLRRDDRAAFIARVQRIANGRPAHFKLHPNERVARAIREIALGSPRAKLHLHGSAEALIANCDVLVTQVSSLTFVGIALGKEVHTDLDLEQLRALCPIQNGGRSAHEIANVCRELIGLPRVRAAFRPAKNPEPPPMEAQP